MSGFSPEPPKPPRDVGKAWASDRDHPLLTQRAPSAPNRKSCLRLGPTSQSQSPVEVALSQEPEAGSQA